MQPMMFVIIIINFLLLGLWLNFTTKTKARLLLQQIGLKYFFMYHHPNAVYKFSRILCSYYSGDEGKHQGVPCKKCMSVFGGWDGSGSFGTFELQYV